MKLLDAHRFFWEVSPRYVTYATKREYIVAYIRFMYYTIITLGGHHETV